MKKLAVFLVILAMVFATAGSVTVAMYLILRYSTGV